MKPKWDRSKGRPEPIQALNRVIENENGEPLVHLSEAGDRVVIYREQVIPFLRKRVVEMLKVASQSLPDGMKFGVIDAWRPFERQVRIYRFMLDCAHEVWPNLDYAQVRRKVCRWVAPVDQKAPPGHCTGAAVDIFLLDRHRKEVDVCKPFGRFQAAPTYTLGLCPEAERNRMAMVNAMLDAGFSNCRDEWWHYSFGDAGWAVRTGRDECIYGLAELPAHEFEEQERIWLEAMKDRKNPFKEVAPD